MEEGSRRRGVADSLLRLGGYLPSLIGAMLRDGAVLGGGALIAYGASQVYEPAGFITAGVELAGIGLAAAWRAAR
jgi:hypothetical protein